MLPHLATHFVEGVGGEFDDMERVETDRRLRGSSRTALT
ncbi:hypothetical protein Pd630_LPD16078 (plasmid) [Rhodococcus opacus PD630]|nr:hypothetical protein Pd630_LPD16078 [Rhodococcus opacus PD630]